MAYSRWVTGQHPQRGRNDFSGILKKMQMHRENNTQPTEDQSGSQDIGTGFSKIFGSQPMAGGAAMTEPVPGGDTQGGLQALLKMLMARGLK